MRSARGPRCMILVKRRREEVRPAEERRGKPALLPNGCQLEPKYLPACWSTTRRHAGFIA